MVDANRESKMKKLFEKFKNWLKWMSYPECPNCDGGSLEVEQGENHDTAFCNKCGARYILNKK